MYKILKSEVGIPLPVVYLVESDEDLAKVPPGIPFIKGHMKDYDYIVTLFEIQVLFLTAEKTKLPFNWEKLLKKRGFTRISAHSKGSTYTDPEIGSFYDSCIKEILIDTSYSVDLRVLKNLKIIPTWFSDLENAVRENILQTIRYNPTLYNKKLGAMVGDAEFSSPERNAIIIDISGSIPMSISKAILALSKTMSLMFYADLIITGSKTTLYEYNRVKELDIEGIYHENGTDNDQIHFKKMVSEYKRYNNIIVFGDDHHPGQTWKNEFNTGTVDISYSEGKRISKWRVNKLISFHTMSNNRVAGYGTWFSPSKIEFQKDWVTDLEGEY